MKISTLDMRKSTEMTMRALNQALPNMMAAILATIHAQITLQFESNPPAP